MMKFITAFCGFLILFTGIPSAEAGVTGRYVRVENPTSGIMVWRQIEVYSGGTNIVLQHPEMFSGTVYPDHNIKTQDGLAMTDGMVNPGPTGVYFPTSNIESDLNPWFEVDLGSPVNIDKIVLTGAEYPKPQYLDKGHRVVTLLDKDRRVVWVAKWDYRDAARYPKGVFTFEPVAKENNPLIGKSIPVNTGSWVPMAWLLNAEQVRLPADAESRMLKFAARNSPAETEKLAQRFFPLLRKMPELEEARRLYIAGKYAEALESWKTYWFAKMKRVHSYSPAHSGGYSGYNAQGDDLVEGIMVTISPGSARAMRYVPGEIRWIDLPDPEDGPALNTALIDCEQKAQVGKVTRPLLDAYRRKPDPKYMKRWAEIMDDWSMNFFEDAAKTPYEAENLFTFNPCMQWGSMMEDLCDAAVENPDMIKAIPASTLARVQLLALEKYSTAWWYQNRYTTFIHISSGLCSWDAILPYLSEFLPGQRAMTEWRQSMERYITMATEPDGSPTDIGDEGHIEFGPGLGFPVGRLEAAQPKPDWYTPGWRNRFMEWDDNSFKYFFRHTSPGGYDHRTEVAYRPERWTSTTKHYLEKYPYKPPFISRDQAFFAIPEVRRILDALGHISAPIPGATDPERAPVIEKELAAQKEIAALLGNEKPGQPHINSDWMPYTGSYYFRSGWNDNDSFISMLAAGSRGGSSSIYGGDTRPRYGSFWHYDYNSPLFAAAPIFVDGLPPQQLNGHFNTCKPGTKIDVLTYAEQKPAQHRWVSTDRFAFGEAIFKGAYQNPPDFQGPWDYRLEMKPEGPAVTGVETTRQILQLRNSRLFIVTDAIVAPSGGEPHTFTIGYQLSLSSKKAEGNPAGSDQLQIDKKGVLRSNNVKGPSVAIYQFADQPIDYQKGPTANPDFQAYSQRLGVETGITNQPVAAEFKNSSKLALVSLVSSREQGGNERVLSVEPSNGNGTTGFHAKLRDGGQLWYQTAGLGTANLVCGPVTAKGQASLVVSEKGALSGMILGAKGFWLNGAPIKINDPDFQFEIVGSKLVMTGIYTPIDPVRFEPNRNAFVDTEAITMVSDTPQVEIRYTTDGTPPTRNSALYSGPVKITESTDFAARAYRLGPDGKPLAADDFEINGTKFSEPTYGWFTKKPLLPAVQVADNELQPGLNYDYLQAPWWRLYASAHWLPAEGGGSADRELDLSKVSTNDTYGMRYKGYIKIPKDGVYTFHSPREFIAMDNVPGYDLRVYVDGQEWYLTQWWHGNGTWSVALKQGFHSFQVDFADARCKPWRKTGNWSYYPRPWVIFQGNPTDIKISGPGLEPARIPQDWLYRKPVQRSYPDERVLVNSKTDLHCIFGGKVDASLAQVNEVCFKTNGKPQEVFGGTVFIKSDGTQVPFASLVRDMTERKGGKGEIFVNLHGAFKHIEGALKLEEKQFATVVVSNSAP